MYVWLGRFTPSLPLSPSECVILERNSEPLGVSSPLRTLLRSRGSPLYVRIRDKFGHMVLVVEHRGKRRQVELAGNCSVETLKETCLVGIPTIPTFSVCSSCAPSTPRSSTTDGSYVTTIYFPPRESRLPRFSI